MAASRAGTGLGALAVSGLVAAFLFLNSSLNLLNKWSLGVHGFRFPFLLASCHMAFGFCVLAPLALRQPWKVHQAALGKQWKGVVCIGTFLALNIALSNISLLDISLSLSQIIRSAIPVVACVLAIPIENRYPTRPEAASLVVLSVGAMLAVWQGAVAGKPRGIAFSIAATVSNGLMMTISSKLMSEKLDVVRLTFYVSPVGLVCLLPFCWHFERQRFAEYWPLNAANATFILLGSSVVAVCYNLAHAAMIKHVSAVATTVLGEVKIVALLLLSALLLGEGKEFSVKMFVGCVLALGGFGGYNMCNVGGAPAPQPSKEAEGPEARPLKS